MNIRDFLTRFFLHCALASAICLSIFVMGERLIPGGISPFVDIIDLALLSALLLVLAAVLDQAPMTSTAKIIGTMVASLISGIGLLYTWLALQELGTVTWFLFLPAIVLVLFMLFTFTTKTESL